MLVIVTDGNIVRNHVIKVARSLTHEESDRLSQVLNANLQGLTMEAINLPVIQKIRHGLGRGSGDCHRSSGRDSIDDSVCG